MPTGTTDHAVEYGGASLTIVVAATALDETLAALTHRRRRHVLYRLREREAAELDELARHVAAAEADVPVEDVEAETVDRVKTALAHGHLPRLDDAGLVDYDPRSGAVRYAHPPPILDRILDVCADVEAPEA